MKEARKKSADSLAFLRSRESQEEATFFDVIAEFEQTHPHIQVEVTGIPFADIDRQYEIAAASRSGPDIVRLLKRSVG